MQIKRFMQHVCSDVVGSIPTSSADNRIRLAILHLEWWGKSIVTRFQCEGFPFLTELTDAYKALMGDLCMYGFPLPDATYCGLPGSVLRVLQEEDDGFVARVLAMFSWPVKLSFAGESEGVADFDGFLSRAREAENWAGTRWEDVIPLSRSDREFISRSTSFKSRFGKHGPGATAEKLRHWDKWLCFQSQTHPWIRMTSVPKDRRKRRLIGIEHASMQFAQQGLAASLRATQWFRSWVTLEDQSAHINFAASSGKCTIDLSDASDRISCSLVEYLLPEWYPLLATCSSGACLTPGGHSARLGMMATMGNGFCFELETLIFHIVTALAGKRYRGKGASLRSCVEACRVYGDDIVAPAAWLPEIELLFARLGWVISVHKTGRTPAFLETCGHYLTWGKATRRCCPTLATEDTMGASRSLAWETQANRLDTALALLAAGLPSTARAVADPVLTSSAYRWNHQLHRHEIKVETIVDVTRPLNVTEDIRLHAYWVCGLVDQRVEPVGQTKRVYQWIPLQLYTPLLALSARGVPLSTP